MSENCIFCQIAAGKIPAKIVFRDEQVTVFHDTQPAAPIHLLIVPNRHLASLNQAAELDAALLGHMLLVGKQLAEEHNIHQSGYRLLINTGADAGQSVFHLHLHLMGGTRLSRMVR